MAPQSTKTRKPQREVVIQSPRAQRKSSMLSAAQQIFRRRDTTNHRGSSSVLRPVREPTTTRETRTPRFVREVANVKEAMQPEKARQTVSAAGMFKNNSKVARPCEKKSRKRREPSPETDLFLDVQDGFEEARVTLGEKSKASFDDIHEGFKERLANTRAMDEAFFETISATTATLSAPLTEELIEGDFKRNGKTITETVKMGKRVAQFKKSVGNEQVKLKEYWKQWDEMQNEYTALGIEVFGAKAFGEDAVGEESKVKGYRREMELLDLEHNARVEALQEEIEEIGVDILKKMKASEKDLDAAAKRDQASVLARLLM